MHSLESPFKKILNTALKHEEKGYECSILSNACPFKNKQFIQKIELGQQKSKEFMDEIMETVVSDLDQPLISKNCFYSCSFRFIIYINYIVFTFLGYRSFEKAVSFGSFGCNIIAGSLVILTMLFALNFIFGIGKPCANPLLQIQHALLFSVCPPNQIGFGCTTCKSGYFESPFCKGKIG